MLPLPRTTDFSRGAQPDQQGGLQGVAWQHQEGGGRRHRDLRHKYAPEAWSKLRHRLRFEPLQKPKVFKAPDGKQVDDTIARDFFGCAQAKASLVRDWNTYAREWDTIPEAVKSVGIHKFRAGDYIKTLLNGRTDLPRLGVWYATFPTSNVASERSERMSGPPPWKIAPSQLSSVLTLTPPFF